MHSRGRGIFKRDDGQAMTENQILLQTLINNILSEPIPLIVALFVLTAYWAYKAIPIIRDKKASNRKYLKIISYGIPLVSLVGFVLFTEVMGIAASQYEFTSYMTVDLIRWLFIYAVVLPLVFIITFKSTKFKSTLIAFFHLSILLLGWVLGKWFGIIIYSVPLIAVSYFLLYGLAQVIFPPFELENNEESKKAKQNKFRALFWFIWGGHYPFWVAKDSTSRDMDKRISSRKFNKYSKPGIAWSHSHQVVGLSFGAQFNKVDGPGLLFLRRGEHPIAVIDLRKQVRIVSDLQAVTQDGISISAALFTSFKIDDSNWKKWDREYLHELWRKVPILQKGTELDQNLDSSFPYSSARVHAALSATSMETPSAPEENGSNIYWDEIVVQRVEREARLALSERTLNELWTPRDDRRGASALDEIEKVIIERVTPRLHELGVKIIKTSVVGFNIPAEDPIRKQLIRSWLGAWEQKTQSIIRDGKTEAEMSRIMAQTSTSDTFMQSIAGSLKKARELDPKLPKQVVALNFISTLERLLENYDPEDEDNSSLWREILQRKRRGD